MNQLITVAHAAWSAGGAVRARRERFKRFTYGDQWGDPAEPGHAFGASEGEVLARAGRKPLTNNLIRRLVKTVVGRYRTMCSENGRYDTAPGSLAVVNDLPELDSRLLEEFLISGVAVQRVVPDIRPAGAAVWVDNVNPCAFFTGDFSDPRGTDVEMLGMLHDMSMAQVLARFAGDDPGRRRSLTAMFAQAGAEPVASPAYAGAASDFFTSRIPGKCRLIELWTLDALDGPGCRFEWRCRWLAPTGDVLAEYASPWAHRGHPFVFRFYPYTDGEVHPFVEDVIDQQKYINRLIMLIDRMMGASAKGVLLFPVDQKVKGFSWEDIRRRWSAADGIIPINGRSEILPQQVVGSSADAGAHRLLELELKLFEDVSGVSDALLGKAAGGNGGAGLYESQLASSTAALADIFDTFNALTARRDALAAGLHKPKL